MFWSTFVHSVFTDNVKFRTFMCYFWSACQGFHQSVLTSIAGQKGLTWSRHLGILQWKRDSQNDKDEDTSSAGQSVGSIEHRPLAGKVCFVASNPPTSHQTLPRVYLCKILFNCIEIQLIIWNIYFHNILTKVSMNTVFCLEF